MGSIFLVLVLIGATVAAWMFLTSTKGSAASPDLKGPGPRARHEEATPAFTLKIREASQAGGVAEAVRIYVVETGAPVSEATRIVTEFLSGGRLVRWAPAGGDPPRPSPKGQPATPASGAPKLGVADHLRKGDRAAAIARYRELSNADEAQAERAVALLEKELASDLPSEVPPGTEANPRELTEGERVHIAKLLMEGKRLEAVDRVRRLTGKSMEASSNTVASIALKIQG